MKQNQLFSKKWFMLCVALLLVLVIAACGKDKNSTDPAPQPAPSNSGTEQPKQEEKPPVVEKDPDPVTVRIFTFPTRIPEEDFDMLLTQSVKKKYPHITVEPMYGTTADREQVLMFSNEKADMIVFWNGEMNYYRDLDLLQDMTPMFKEHNFDLDRFQPGLVGTAKGPNGEVYGLPYNNNVQMMYYNKNLFDKFGVDYPKDGMFWEDVLELSKTMARTVDGVDYYGYHYDFYFRLTSPLSLAEVNDATMKATVNTDEWKKALGMIKSFHDISGNVPAGNYRNKFIQDQDLAMIGAVNILHLLKDAENNGLAWDIAQYPSWQERPNAFGYADLHELGVTKVSQNPDAAMKVMEVFFSDEVQLEMARKTGRVSTLKGMEFTSQYGADVPHLQGKNIAGIFKSIPAPTPDTGISRYWGDAYPIVSKYVSEMVKGTMDINTALLTAEEEINLKLEEKKK